MTRGMVLRVQDSEMVQEECKYRVVTDTNPEDKRKQCVCETACVLMIVNNFPFHFFCCLNPHLNAEYFLFYLLCLVYTSQFVCQGAYLSVLTCTKFVCVFMSFFICGLWTFLCTTVMFAGCVCDCVHALSTPWHVWLPPFRPGPAVTRQGNQDPVSGWMRL